MNTLLIVLIQIDNRHSLLPFHFINSYDEKVRVSKQVFDENFSENLKFAGN